MSSMSYQRTDTTDMDVKVAIERTFLGWLCAATGLTPKVAMCHLYDLCVAPLEHLMKKNGTWVSRKVNFPDSTIKLKINCSRFHDRDLYLRYVKAWEEACKAAGLKLYQNDDAYHQWCKANPRPKENWQDPAYNYVKCKFTCISQDKEIVMSQHEMESMMTETFLLGGDDE